MAEPTTTANSGSAPDTVVDEIVAKRGGWGRLTVLAADGTTTALPWSAVHDRARRVAPAVREYTGVRPGGPRGPRVGLLADSHVDLVTALQAVWLCGGAVTVLPLPIGIAREAYLTHLLGMLSQARLDLLVLGPPVETLAPVLARAVPVVRLAALVETAATATAAEPAHPAPGDLAILQFSSGSTGNPRAVPVTHGHLAANLRATRAAVRHGRVEHGTMLSWLPLYHDMGLIGFLALPMACGCPLVLMSPMAFAQRPSSWLDAVTRHRPTVSAAPNFVIGLMTRLLPGRTDVDLSSLRSLLCGSEPVAWTTTASFASAAERVGLDRSVIAPAYGLAEATMAVTVSPPGVGVRVDWVDAQRLETEGRAVPPRPGAAGRSLVRLGPPIPGMAVRIVDRRTGERVDERRLGRIEVRGDAVVGHYWGEPAGEPGGWFDTGDVGYLVDGELVVCGRAKDVIFAAGRTIFPQDVELAAARVPGVRQGGAVAFAVDGSTGDHLVVAVEEGRHTISAEALRRDVRAEVVRSVGLRPGTVVVLPPHRLPRTSSGKLRRAEARRQYLAGQLAPPGYRGRPPAEPTERQATT
jgi:fatty-acyl-CoA synthase